MTVPQFKPPAAPEKPRQSGTLYRVLRLDESGWQVRSAVEASNADFAIRLVAADDGAGTYVAIPERSWKPRKLTVESRPIIKLS